MDKNKNFENEVNEIIYEYISTSYNIPIRFIFIGMLLTSCEGWSVMGYALDESQENKIDSIEIDE